MKIQKEMNMQNKKPISDIHLKIFRYYHDTFGIDKCLKLLSQCTEIDHNESRTVVHFGEGVSDILLMQDGKLVDSGL